jgi:hypothetical protein
LFDALDASEVLKTDVREFALLAANKHPEKMAALTKKAAFGTVYG